ncbi:MAG: GC-type dockerin domain-anchored protein [Phycisphaerales bacterium]|jgi:hypothetical protein|nr:GC-type dockerin domain-anchored protein [Phycisphaerales bacterium]
MQKPLAVLAVAALACAASAQSFNPVVVHSVLDQPLDGNGDTINGLTGLIRQQGTRADRAMQEYDISSLAGKTIISANISGMIFNNNAGGNWPRVFVYEVYSGNGTADVTDYEIAPVATVGGATWELADVTVGVAISEDVTSVLQALVDANATHFGFKVRADASQSNLFPTILSGSTDDAVLTVVAQDGGDPCDRDCDADWDGSGGSPDSSDFLAYLNDWSSQNPCADLAPAGGDGAWDSSDFLAFLNAFSTGC